MNRVITGGLTLFWIVVLILTFMNKMMLAMYLMAIGMFLCSLNELARSIKK